MSLREAHNAIRRELQEARRQIDLAIFAHDHNSMSDLSTHLAGAHQAVAYAQRHLQECRFPTRTNEATK